MPSRTDGAIGSPRREDRLVGLVDRVAVFEGVHQHGRHPRQHAVDHEAGCVPDEDGALAEPVVGSQAVASVTSSVAWVRISSTSGSTATGLKKCMPTSRCGVGECRGHRGDGQRRGVRRQDAVGGTALELGEDVLLDASSSNRHTAPSQPAVAFTGLSSGNTFASGSTV